MAWNEPGGGDKKDPWGGGNNQGPPDLDEALKKFQDKISSIFGGAGGAKSGGGNDANFGSMLLVALIVGFVLWAGSGIYQVDEKDRAVVLRLGKYHETYGPGLHWMPSLIDQKIIVRMTEERQYMSRGKMLTEDENIVEIPLTVQYNVADPKAFALNVRDPERSLQQATDSALRHVVGSSTLDSVVSTGRALLGDEVKLRLQQYLDIYGTGINIININIQEAKPPTEVKAAYDDVIKAREDQERLINESQAYANGIIPEARGAAQRMIEEATAYRDKVIVEADGEAKRFVKLLVEYKKAPVVTRERIYLDAVEQVMMNSSKVFIDIEGGNNMLYLPLDQMMRSSSSGSRAAGSAVNEIDVNAIADEVIRKLRREQTSTSRRGLR